MLAGLGTLAYVAIDDPNFALEPNYYDKAVHWDRSQAEARHNSELGLKIELVAPLAMGADGKVDVRFSVKDRRDLAFSGAEVEVEAFPNAFASRVEHVNLRETEPGLYTGELARGVRGLWELRIVVKEGSLRYGDVQRHDVGKGDSA